MKSEIVMGLLVCVLVSIPASPASASTASQREYKRGYADCAAGRWDENQHGASYKKGCRAAEDKRGAPAVVSGDAKVSGTDFHATGDIPCAIGEGQPVTQCHIGVIRQGAGSATVKVTLPGGGERSIVFKKGKASSSDSPAGVTSEKVSDLNKVFIGTTERYEIPDAVLFGG